MGLDTKRTTIWKKKTICSIVGFNSSHKKHAIRKTQVIAIMKTYPLLWWRGAKNTIVQCSIWLHFPRLMVVWSFRTPFVSKLKECFKNLGNLSSWYKCYDNVCIYYKEGDVKFKSMMSPMWWVHGCHMS